VVSEILSVFNTALNTRNVSTHKMGCKGFLGHYVFLQRSFNMRCQSLVVLLLVVMLTPLTVSATCNSNVVATTPDSRYLDNKDGTVTDTVTGLIWKRCSEGQTWNGTTCIGTASTYTWAPALQAGPASNFTGKSDWRLPNINELKSIVEHQCYAPTINLNIFPNTPSWAYWSASPVSFWPGGAWFVAFDEGYDNYTGVGNTGGIGVHLVRGGL